MSSSNRPASIPDRLRPPGRELPPDLVFAADQRITAWAGELKSAGLEGGVDELRARAMLDLLLGQDSRPGQDGATTPAASPAGGFAARVNLTMPLSTAVGLADRPGEIPGIGPIDPWLARDLAAAARNPKTTWCVTVTDGHGYAVAHGCAKPEPKRHRKRAGPGPRDGPGFAFTATAEPGTWRLRVPGAGPDQHPARGGRADVPVQRRSEVSAGSPAQAGPALEGRPASRRDVPVDHPDRPDLHH